MCNYKFYICSCPIHRAFLLKSIMITARAIIISIILIVFLSVWTIYTEHFVGSINSISPPPGAIFLFFFLVLFNSVLSSRKLNLKKPELLLIYSLLLVSAPISSFAISRFFVSILLAPFYFATPENEFSSLFHGIIPNWFSPREPWVVRGYYEPLGRGIPWEAWLKPLSIWIPFIIIAYTMMLCLSIIIHRQWIDRERLTFPTVFLPMQLAETPEPDASFNSFIKNKFLWAGFAIPFTIHGINGLSFYHPVIPTIPLKNDFSRFLTDSPWNAVDMLPTNFYPNVIGFSYLLPVDISFSCWFFYLLSKMGMVFGALFGWKAASPSGIFPFSHYQSAGAFIALIILSLWASKKFLISTFIESFRPKNAKIRALDDDATNLYRFAFIGLVVTALILVFWFIWVGLKPFVILVFLMLFIIYSLSAGRVRTEAGLGAVSGPVRMDDLLKSSVGTKRIGIENLTVLSYLRWITIDLRGFMSAIPAQLESFKIIGRPTKSLKWIPILILASVTIALVVSCISLLWVSYGYGAFPSGVNGWWILSGPQETFGILRHNILNLQGTDWVGLEFLSIGFIVSCVLIYMRNRFLWIPFHPIGYAVGFSRLSMDWIWLSVFIGWGIKLCIIKYGGLRLNRKIVPVSLGLVLGDFFMAGLWSIAGAFSGGIMYQVFP